MKSKLKCPKRPVSVLPVPVAGSCIDVVTDSDLFDADPDTRILDDANPVPVPDAALKWLRRSQTFHSAPASPVLHDNLY